ncbi:unnamed protein product [Macrosiphum euphorbiae]|uniref:SAM domain-containing protein n=1 Tax=Macrosiphum euphorbiae TaxID=13131 RepID=A0AAV0XM44_9HEMI|nr:unnamed protein product [Macrosiphum euphorbiae]
MADNDVVDFLKAWDLVKYIDIFRDNEIDMKTLLLLTEDMIKELVPVIGHRARLISNLQEWKAIVQGATDLHNPLDIEPRDNIGSILLELTQTDTTNSKDYQHIIPFTSVDTTASTPSSTLQVETTEEVSDDFDVFSTNVSQKSYENTELIDLLQSANEGKALLATYQKKGLLDSIGRRRLCNLIINRELRDDVNKRVPSSRLHELAYQITLVFSQERTAVYFIPYLSYGPGLKRAAKGKLLDCLNNRRRDYRKSGIINTSRRSSTSSSGPSSPTEVSSGLNRFATINPQEDVEENLKWLRNSSDPWKLVEENWDKTVHIRLNKIASKDDGQSIVQYMTEYPALKKPTGYLLFLKDFDTAFPNSSDKLYQNLPLYKRRIFELAGEKIRKSKELDTNELLNSYLQFDVVDKEETSNIVAFLCLPFIIGVNSTRAKKSKALWRPSKLEARDGFITHVKSDAEILETVTRRREKLRTFGQTLQPFIVIVGPTINEISSYLVIVDNTYYRLNTIIAAVDCCFKVILTLNAEYPTESALIWCFIQKGFYNITTPWDKNFTVVNALLSDINCLP